jgi:hypothetical protein
MIISKVPLISLMSLLISLLYPESILIDYMKLENLCGSSFQSGADNPPSNTTIKTKTKKQTPWPLVCERTIPTTIKTHTQK